MKYFGDMKQVLKIKEELGRELRTRQMMERLSANLLKGDEYLFDFTDVELISRSAADELYNIVQDNKVEVVGMSEFVQKMYDAVKRGRFMPRQLRPSGTPVVHCKDMADVDRFLMIM